MVTYDDWGNEKPSWGKARIIRVTVGTILLLGAVGGAAYGIYHVTHKKKHNDNGGSYSPGDSPIPVTTSNYSFPNALKLSLSYLNVQKSGKLPANFPITWRGDSCLKDGQDNKVDLTGGLFDAGDYMKFGLPMAFTATILAWGSLEYGTQMHAAGQLTEAVDRVKWITDYLIKCHNSPNSFYHQVGDPDIDHKCWQRAEDIDQSPTSRPSSKVDGQTPGSDVAGEAAAAMAAASILFRNPSSYQNTTYADLLVKHARQLFSFASTYPGLYTDSFPSTATYYNSTGYEDELLWAATWLYEATGESTFLDYVTGDAGQNYAAWGESPLWLSWDDKRPAVQVLLSRNQLLTSTDLGSSQLTNYRTTADDLMCALIPNSPTSTKRRTKGGMIWITEWGASIETVNAAFLALVYSDYLVASKGTLACSGHNYNPDQLRHFAFTQADYLLGNNPAGKSFLVGYGKSYPDYLHHRGASIPDDGTFYGCNDGFDWLDSAQPNPNVAGGALVGGPFLNETFIDSRNNTQQNEAGTYNSATLAGLVAGLSYLAPGGVPKSLSQS